MTKANRPLAALFAATLSLLMLVQTTTVPAQLAATGTMTLVELA